MDEQGKITREGEERRLLDVANPPLQRRIIGALETGCRDGELANLLWADVDLVRRELRVRAETSKTRRGRVLPISARLAAVLEMTRSALEAVLFDGEGACYGAGAHTPHRPVLCVRRCAWVAGEDNQEGVGAHGGDRRALPGRELLGQQCRGRRLAAVLAQAHHLAVRDIGQDGPESLALASLNLIKPM